MEPCGSEVMTLLVFLWACFILRSFFIWVLEAFVKFLMPHNYKQTNDKGMEEKYVYKKMDIEEKRKLHATYLAAINSVRTNCQYIQHSFLNIVSSCAFRCVRNFIYYFIIHANMPPLKFKWTAVCCKATANKACNGKIKFFIAFQMKCIFELSSLLLWLDQNIHVVGRKKNPLFSERSSTLLHRTMLKTESFQGLLQLIVTVKKSSNYWNRIKSIQCFWSKVYGKMSLKSIPLPCMHKPKSSWFFSLDAF